MVTDIVDVEMFLRGCAEPLDQYRECLMKNLNDWSGRGLHRHKLSKVKIHHLSQMNITRFDHQKMIMARIRELPNISSMPKYDLVSEMEPYKLVEADAHASKPQSQRRGSTCISSMNDYSHEKQPYQPSGADRRASYSKDDGGRRRSTLTGGKGGVKGGRTGSLTVNKNWEAINKARVEADGSARQKQLGNIRRRKTLAGGQVTDVLQSAKPNEVGGKASGGSAESYGRASSTTTVSAGSKSTANAEISARRSSLSLNNFDPTKQAKIKEAQAKRQRAINYGNSASKASSREEDLKELKKQILADFVDTVGCERATLMLLNTPSQEIFFFDGPFRVSFPLKTGIAGYCASTGVGILVNDPYSHPLFNPQIDRMTDFTTRNILCEPIKSRKGGNVVAVLQMLNKKGGQHFTEQDSAVMEMCAVRVANALDTTFEAVVSAENEWARVAGRRRSVGDARLLTTAEAAIAAATAQAGFESSDDKKANLDRRRSSEKGKRRSSEGDSGALELRASLSGPQISNRRGSGSSTGDSEKFKRRTEYGKEVRDSAIGLL